MYQIRNICSSDCDLFELFGYSLQVPVPPELDATEHDSSEPNSMEEGASATSRKLKYAASRFVTFQLITMAY
jgi:hypothetical protein